MNHSTTATATVTDPICGMSIDPATAAGSSTYDGETYYFCHAACEQKFDAAPELYAGTKKTSCCSVRRPAAPAGHCC